MSLIGIKAFLASAPAAQPGTTVNPTAQMLQTLALFGVMGLTFYFVLIRPQQKKSREHAELLKTLKPGDKIVTSGGVVGVVVSVKDKTVSIRSADTKLEVLKSAVSEVSERGSGTAES
jgi:preprotein translocase subunit YajC